MPQDSALHAVILDAAAEMPAGGALVVISRTDPPPAMARLRASRALEVVGWHDLRLTRAESDDLIERLHGPLDEAAFGDLYARTQGWAAGLVLMLDRVSADGRRAVADLDAPQVLFDYLAGEVFEAFGEPLRELLVTTAMLPEFTAEMAAELSGQDRLGERLRELQRGYHLVHVKPGVDGLVYQYHPMLREFLLARAAERLSAPARAALRQRAAAALERTGQLDAARGLLREAGDDQALARLLKRVAPALLRDGRAETLEQALDDLPRAVLDDEPWLLHWQATCRFYADPREARLLYERAFAGFSASSPRDESGMFLSSAAAIDALIYELHDLSLLDRWIEEITVLLMQSGESEDPHVSARVAASMFMALVFRQPWHPDIGTWAQRTYQQLDDIDDATTRLTAQLLLAINLNYTGQFDKALDFVGGMRRLCRSPNVPAVALTVLKDVESMYYMLTADSERCVSAVHEGLEIARSRGVHLWSYHILSNGVAGALAAGNLATAEGFLSRMREYREGARRLDLCIYHYCTGWLATLRGEPVEALRELKTALRLAVECGCPFYEALCRLAMAPVCAECDDLRRARRELRSVRAITRGIDNRLFEYMGLLGYAHYALAHGRERSGLRALRRALEVGREHGFRHFLGWRPEHMSSLCERALVEGIEVDYARSLIRERGLLPATPVRSVSHWPWSLSVHALGEFEVLKDGERLEMKSKQRPAELLRALVGLGAEDVPESVLAEIVWPRINRASAHRSLTTNLYRLRQLLGEDGVIRLRHGRISLDASRCWLDVRAFEGLDAAFDDVLREPCPQTARERVEALSGEVFDLYRGPFMAAEPDARYAAGRERLRSRFLRFLGNLAGFWEAAGEPDRAAAHYEKGIEVDSLSESLYRRLMLCLQGLGRQAEAVDVYDRCRSTLLAETGVDPSRETTAIYERIVREL